MTTGTHAADAQNKRWAFYPIFQERGKYFATIASSPAAKTGIFGG